MLGFNGPVRDYLHKMSRRANRSKRRRSRYRSTGPSRRREGKSSGAGPSIPRHYHSVGRQQVGDPGQLGHEEPGPEPGHPASRHHVEGRPRRSGDELHEGPARRRAGRQSATGHGRDDAPRRPTGRRQRPFRGTTGRSRSCRASPTPPCRSAPCCVAVVGHPPPSLAARARGVKYSLTVRFELPHQH